jgi:hemerythrin-like domain-containing protein
MSSILSKFLPEGIQQYRSLSRQYRGPRKQLGPTSWPETPFKLISSTGALSSPHISPDHYCRKNAVIMAQTHNTIFRGFNAIYHQAPLVSPGTQDAEDLLFYCMVVHDFLEAHHTAEETTYFPAIEKTAGIKGLMENNVEQHKAFEEAVWRFRVYALTTTRWTYRADELRHLIDQLAEPLERHLHDEIPSILDLHSKVDSTALERIYSDMHHTAEKHSDKWRSVFSYGFFHVLR